MSEVIKPWGQVYHSGIKYSDDWNCPSGDWGWLQSFDLLFPNDRYKNVIGFSPNQPFLTHHIEGSVGIAILECPKCFEKFWFHISTDKIENYIKHCPGWPK